MNFLMKQIFLFTKEDCTPCKMVKQYLKSENVEVKEFDIFEHPDTIAHYEVMSVPTLVYMEEYDSYKDTDINSDLVTKVVGFDMPKLESVLQKYKK